VRIRCCRSGLSSSERTLGRRDHAGHARVQLKRHAQGTGKGLEHRLGLVVGVFAAQVVDVQGDKGVVGKALKKFVGQLRVKAADVAPGDRVLIGARVGEDAADSGRGIEVRR